MARPRSHPAPPRITAPDLPRHLVSGRLARHADLTGAAIGIEVGSADGAHARLSESSLSAASVDRIELTGGILSDVHIGDVSAAELVARDGAWRTVTLVGGRLGTLDAGRARWDGVEVRGVRIDYLSAPAAILRDVRFVDCRIGTLDAPGSTLERVQFAGTTVDEFDTRELRAADLDLRGLDALAFTDIRALRNATVSLRQAEAHAAALAQALGIEVRDDARDERMPR